MHQSQSARWDLSRWHLDIDRYLIPFIPPPPWHLLPRPISHMLGYRKEPPKSLGNVVVAMWSFLGAFCGVALVAGVSMHVPSFRAHDVPIIIASFGAAAILQFSAVESPLAQPRNAFLSQLFASVIGVGISKLFALNQHAQSVLELGGALACAITAAVMVLTNTVHPPAGATALLAVTSTPNLGWFLIPVMMLGCALMLGAALVLNNIQRRYPLYWWTPHSLARQKPADPESGADTRKQEDSPTLSEDSFLDSSNSPLLVIRRGKVLVPEGIYLTETERDLLEGISNRI